MKSRCRSAILTEGQDPDSNRYYYPEVFRYHRSRRMPVTTVNVKDCIRDYEGYMVPDAFFKEHVCGRWT